MDAYNKFAEIYDSLMTDVPYKEITQIIDKRIKENNVKNNLVLDLACGTGTLSQMLVKSGYDVIGADLSAEMLNVAREKCPEVLFLNQSMTDFELYGTVGTIVCCLDSINYLTDSDSLDEMIRLCNNYLEPDGLLIFDINTEYKFENILADNVFTYDNDNVYYVWENDYDEAVKLCDFYLTFFVKEEEKYTRFEEVHTERVYTENEIENSLRKNGFDILEKLDGFTENKATENSERIMYVCKNVDSIQAKHIGEL